jgi:hypothetical protein
MLHARTYRLFQHYAKGPYIWTKKTTSYLETVCSIGSPDLKQLQGCWTGEKHAELRYQ